MPDPAAKSETDEAPEREERRVPRGTRACRKCGGTNLVIRRGVLHCPHCGPQKGTR